MSIIKKNNGILFPPLVGYSFSALLRILRANKILPKYYLKVFTIIIINLINLPFRIYEQVFINPRFEKKSLINPPIFIIGHWRSGTTHLHNLLSQDSQMGYVTTYQSVFPNTLFNKLGRFIFQNFMSLLIPKKREGDNVTLGIELPQEEEFTLGHKVPLSFYLFWFFPKKSATFFKKYIKMEGINKKEVNRWEKEMKLMMQKALHNTNGTIFLSKNPPNTARVALILELFPDAKFIHIHRNPVDVYLSTQNFFRKMMPHLKLEDITEEEINEIIITGYKSLMKDYFKHKNLIPEKNLFELSFEQLEKKPIEVLEIIYRDLNLTGFSQTEKAFKDYIEVMSHYKKNQHSINRKELEVVLNEWKFVMDKFNYMVPKNIKIIEDVYV